MRKGKGIGKRYAPRREIDAGRRWYVAATLDIADTSEEGRADWRADKALRKAGLDVWLPTYHDDVVRHGRIVEAELLFFPGYLFVGVRPAAAVAEEVSEIRRCRHVAGLLGVDGPLALQPRLVQAIADAFTGDVRSERVQAAALYHVGEMVRVAGGPFVSFVATVTELLRGGHVKADVEVFGRAVPVQFEPNMLERTRRRA